MKLTRSELIRATDKQLSVIAIPRKNNSGWLKIAMNCDFTEQVIAEFRAADMRRPKLRPITLERQDETSRLYRELLYAVVSKWPNESRHQTALRYIMEAEQRISGPDLSTSPESYANRIYESNRLEFTEPPR